MKFPVNKHNVMRLLKKYSYYKCVIKASMISATNQDPPTPKLRITVAGNMELNFKLSEN